jgi:hypothetical protein
MLLVEISVGIGIPQWDPIREEVILGLYTPFLVYSH